MCVPTGAPPHSKKIPKILESNFRFSFLFLSLFMPLAKSTQPGNNGQLKCKSSLVDHVPHVPDTNGHSPLLPLPDTDNQRVIIHVKDVNDEPPYFINRPLPMQAVVQLNAPPNTPVFTLQARDPDTDHNIHYFIVRDRTGGRFEVDERSGVVRTRGTDLFQLDMEYVLYVKAEDQNGKVDDRRFQSTPEERLSIVGGKRAPQFYMPSYEAEIPENQKKDSE